MRSVCENDTNGDGDCPACARNPEAPCRLPLPPAEWPEELRGAFWSAVNAPTYAESAGLTLKFVHALAERQREKRTDLTDSVVGWFAVDAAADLIDPEAAS